MTLIDPSLISLKQPVAEPLPLVVAVPHAGRDYGPRFTAGTAQHGLRLRLTEDAFADELAARAPEAGSALLCALFPRIWLDVNRDARELDPLLIDGSLPEDSMFASNNVRAGLGVVPRLLTGGSSIYTLPLPLAEAEARIEAAWRPYHAALARLLDEARQRFGACLLVDCHTMPTGREMEPPDIVLGDAFGQTCETGLVVLAERFFAELGYRVARNRPYAGGFTTRHYGKPETGLHALQIEIRRGLYMDEQSFERSLTLPRLAEELGQLFGLLGRALQALKA